MKVTQFNMITQCLILVNSLFFYAVCGSVPWAESEPASTICRYALLEVYRRYTAVTVYLCDLGNISLSSDPQ